MNNHEKKSIGIDASNLQVDFGERIIQGYFSIFGNVDQGGDIVRKGAFKKTIAERGPRQNAEGKWNSKIKMAYNHGKVIGIPILLREDGTGGYFEGRVSKTQFGDDILTMVDDGTIDGCSFEYKVMKADYPKEDKEVTREIIETKMYEAGPVDYAMNETAGITGRKSRESIGEMCDQLLYLICKKNTDISEISQLKALYSELTERLRVAEEQSLSEIEEQPSGDLVLQKLFEFEKRIKRF